VTRTRPIPRGACPRPLTESLIFTWTVASDLLNSGVAISGRWPRLLPGSRQVARVTAVVTVQAEPASRSLSS
jgi:hypothetical protein